VILGHKYLVFPFPAGSSRLEPITPDKNNICRRLRRPNSTSNLFRKTAYRNRCQPFAAFPLRRPELHVYSPRRSLPVHLPELLLPHSAARDKGSQARVSANGGFSNRCAAGYNLIFASPLRALHPTFFGRSFSEWRFRPPNCVPA
jgi:hypothetical protein